MDLAFDCLSVYFCSIYSRLWPLVSIMTNAHMMVQNRVIKKRRSSRLQNFDDARKTGVVVEISDMMMCKIDHYTLKAPLEQTLYTVLNCVADRATGRKGDWEYQPFQHSSIVGLR